MTQVTSAVFALNPTHCSACGRPLQDATSQEFGIGPVCRKKYNYEDAYDIPDTMVKQVKEVLDNLSDTDVVDRTLNAALDNDSRRAVNVLNHAVAVWARNGGELDDIMVCLDAMRVMGYTTLADRVGSRLAEVTITVENGRVVLDTPYNSEFVSAIKQVQGRRWDGENKVWTVPAENKKDAWQVLLQCYKGKLASGPKGMFRIEA